MGDFCAGTFYPCIMPSEPMCKLACQIHQIAREGVFSLDEEVEPGKHIIRCTCRACLSDIRAAQLDKSQTLTTLLSASTRTTRRLRVCPFHHPSRDLSFPAVDSAALSPIHACSSTNCIE